MKILYDYQIFNIQKYGGISRYFYELLKQLSLMNNIDIDLPILYSSNFYLMNSSLLNKDVSEQKPDNIFFGIQFAGMAKIERILGRLSILEHPMIENQKLSIDKIVMSNYDVFHPTYYDNYFLKYVSDKPFVLTVYDMIHEILSGKYLKRKKGFIDRKKILMNKAAHIIAISENTKKDIIDIYGIENSKISVVYLGNSLDGSISGENNITLPENYLLYVGDRGAYKNFIFFIKSIKPLLNKEKDLFLVCAGSTAFSSKEKSIIAENGLTEKIVFFPLVDDQTLTHIYKKALCLVFPTLYEGFGIPVLEAFACGCPAVISNTSSLPEVGGDAVLYFYPEDADSILESVKKVVFDKEVQKELSEKGIEQLKKFSWKKCALQTRSVYQNIIAEGRK